MKTVHIFKLTLMMVLPSIVFMSCSKIDSGPVNSTNNSKASFYNGTIIDKGFLAGVRQMQVVLSNQNNNFYNANGSASLADTIVSVVFYSDPDNLVPTGLYNYSDSPGNGPFTFGDASLYLQNADYSGSLPIASIKSGSVNVSYVDSQYDITFDCILSNGEMFRKEFHGGMSYLDAH